MNEIDWLGWREHQAKHKWREKWVQRNRTQSVRCSSWHLCVMIIFIKRQAGMVIRQCIRMHFLFEQLKRDRGEKNFFILSSHSKSNISVDTLACVVRKFVCFSSSVRCFSFLKCGWSDFYIRIGMSKRKFSFFPRILFTVLRKILAKKHPCRVIDWLLNKWNLKLISQAN